MSDLSPLTDLAALQTLDLTNAPLSDLSSLAGLTARYLQKLVTAERVGRRIVGVFSPPLLH